MTNEYETYQDYWNEVQATAKRYFDYGQERAEEIETAAFNLDDISEDEEVPFWAIVEAAVRNHELVQYYQRTVIYYAQNDFYDEGGERYFTNSDDQRTVISELAHAGFHNDVRDSIDLIYETREELGEAVQLIEGPIFGSGVELTYTYEKGLMNPEYLDYTLESLGECEWRVIDPDGEAFNVISPTVAVENADREIPEYSLKLFLDNTCAKRERERETQQ